MTVVDGTGNIHDRAGKFAGRTPARQAGGPLTEDTAEDPSAGLEDALASCGLAGADLPGVRRAWADRFGPLDGPEPAGEAAPDAARVVLTLDDDQDVTAVRPQPDGSVHVDTENDEGWTERTFVVTAGTDADRLVAAAARDEDRRHRPAR